MLIGLQDRIIRASPLQHASSAFLVSAIGLAAALLLGGGTGQGLLSDGVLQLLYVPILCFGLMALAADGAPRHLRFALVFVAVVVGLPLLQLVPLPPDLAAILPYHPMLQSIQAMSGQAPGWWPISVVPEATLQAVLSLIVPVGLYLCCIRLSFRERRWLMVLMIGFGFVSAALGLVQIAQGPASALRFYEITNSSEAVGFFANRNHLSALLYVTWLFAVIWFVDKLNSLIDASARARADGSLLLPTMALSFAVVVLLVAQLMARSRAGLILAGIAMVLVLFIAAPARNSGSWLTPRRLIGGALALIVVLSSQYALVRVLERFGHDPLEDARVVFAKRTLAAALAFLPSGAGVGTFVPVYALFERPQDTLLDTFANRAHNDFLEVFLELGVFGGALILLFCIWLAVRSWGLVKRPRQSGSELDRRLALAAAAGLLLLVVHSAADYPLRTGGLMAVFAVLAALVSAPAVLDPRDSEGDDESDFERSPAKFHKSKAPRVAQAPPAERPPITAPQGAWGEGIAWPEAWLQPPKVKN